MFHNSLADTEAQFKQKDGGSASSAIKPPSLPPCGPADTDTAFVSGGSASVKQVA